MLIYRRENLEVREGLALQTVLVLQPRILSLAHTEIIFYSPTWPFIGRKEIEQRIIMRFRQAGRQKLAVYRNTTCICTSRLPESALPLGIWSQHSP